jgi:hypothetical protein
MSLASRASICLGAVPLCLAMGAGSVPETPLSAQLTLQTDRVTYDGLPTLEEPPYLYEFTLVARLKNETARPLQLKRRCPLGDADLQGKAVPDYDVPAVDEEQDSGYSPIKACGEIIPTPVIVLQPGEARTDTLRIEGPTAWDHHTKRPLGILAGRFRLVYELYPCKGALDCDEVRSNEFEVRLGR